MMLSLQHLFADDITLYTIPVFPADWRVLITGVTSIHGWPVLCRLQQFFPPERLMAIRSPKMQVPRGENIFPLCITDRDNLKKIRDKFRPTHVIHAAGVCDLDVCEARPAWARALNHEGSAIIKELFHEQAYLLFLSTDLVFSGNQPPVNGYTEVHEPDPVSIAGKTFLDAEKEIEQSRRYCILRLGLPIGASVNGDKGAVDFVEGRFKRGLFMSLFHDELRSCITCEEIAELVIRILATGPEGIFHCGGKAAISLHGIGEAIIREGGYPPSLLKCLSRHEEINGPPRIGNVALDSSKLVRWLRASYPITIPL